MEDETIFLDWMVSQSQNFNTNEPYEYDLCTEFDNAEPIKLNWSYLAFRISILSSPA